MQGTYISVNTMGTAREGDIDVENVLVQATCQLLR